MKYDYDIICIGMGPAGMAVSAMASEMGLKVLAIEKRKVGGECLNCGCIPSKALLKMAHVRHYFNRLKNYELSSSPLPQTLNTFKKINDDLKFINEKKTMGMFKKVKMILKEGPASFIDDNTIEVAEKQYSAKKIFIAVGTEPTILPIPGIENVEVLTNENIFQLEKIPESLTVLGGGAIAVEMAQGFSRLGSKVTLIQRSKHILSKNDTEAAEILEKEMESEGIELHTGVKVSKIEKEKDDIVIHLNNEKIIKSKKLLSAVGRTMNFSDLKLDNAGVKYSEKGIYVDDTLRTSNKNIYAVGDCNGFYKFSHAAMHQGMLALMNTMMPGPFKRKFKHYSVPSTIFTEPQISQVGMSEKELQSKGILYEIHKANYEDYGAAIAEEVKTGFVKVFVSKWGKIYGAVIVGDGSGEMINEWSLAIQKKTNLIEIMMLQHSFPTMGFLSKRIAEIWMMSKMKSETLKNICRKVFHFFN